MAEGERRPSTILDTNKRSYGKSEKDALNDNMWCREIVTIKCMTVYKIDDKKREDNYW